MKVVYILLIKKTCAGALGPSTYTETDKKTFTRLLKF